MTEPYLPTPEEIRAACKELQEGWTEGVERQRRTGTSIYTPYELPTGKLEDLIPPKQQGK